MIWTLVDTATGQITATGQSARPPPARPGATLLPGVRGDARTQRATAARDALEDRPPLAATVLPASVGVGEPVTVTTPEPAMVGVDGEPLAEVAAGSYTIAFPEPGAFALRLAPAAPASTALPVELLVTVTPGGTPAPADYTAGERPQSLRAEIRAKLADFDVAITRAEAREAAAAAFATRPITTLVEARQAVRDLADIARQSENDAAVTLRYLRRCLFALIELVERKRA